MTYPIYPKYKNTNTPWIGGIPAHWELLPGLAVIQENKTKNSGLIETQVLSLSYGRIVIKPLDKLHGLVPESFETYQIVDPGDIIIRPTDLQNDKKSLRVGQVKNRGIITSAYISLKPKYLGTEDFLFRLFQAYDFMKVFYGLGSGLRQNMGFNDLRRLPILLPPLNEQILITKYLTHMEIKIAHLMQKKKRLIALLKEQKRAIINQAITRGLDPNEILKPSRLEWLCDIPDHWEILPIKRLVKTKMADGPHETPVFLDEGVPFVSADAVKDGKIILSRRRGNISTQTHKIYCNKIKPKKNDIFIVKSGSTTGKVCIVDFDEEFSIWSPLALVRVKDSLSASFVYYAISSDYFQRQVRDKWSFGTQPNIGMGVLQNLFIALPSNKDEQLQILNFIENESKPIDLMISKINHEVDLIQEYRTRLISDVVTGKIDIRNINIEKFDDSDIQDELIDIEELDEESLELTGVADEND